jgi:plastocyanin
MKRSTEACFILLVAVFMILSYSKAAFAHTPSPSVNNDAVANVDIQDFSFNPSSLTVRPPNNQTGETVMISWFNHGANVHSVTSGTPAGTADGIIDHSVSPGTFYNLTITQSLYNQIIAKYPSGALPYFCKYHYSYGMTATLTVAGTPIPEFSLPSFLLTVSLISIILLSMIKYSSKLKPKAPK